MVNGLPSLEEGTALLLDTARLSVLGRPIGSSPKGSRTDWEPSRGGAAPRNGSRQRPAPDPECGERAGRCVSPGQDGGSQGTAYNAHAEGNEDRPQTGPPRSSDHHTMALPPRRLRLATLSGARCGSRCRRPGSRRVGSGTAAFARSAVHVGGRIRAGDSFFGCDPRQTWREKGENQRSKPLDCARDPRRSGTPLGDSE